MLIRGGLIVFVLCFFAFTVQAEEKVDYQKLSRAELTELFVKGIAQKKIIEKIKNDYPLVWNALPKTYFALVKKYIGCYPPKSYFKVENRGGEFFKSTNVPDRVELLDEQYLIIGGFRKHEADVKGLFLFDLKEKEAVISLLNYTKGEIKPFIDIYVSPTASSQLVGKGVELVRDWINVYMTTVKTSYFTKFPPFTLYTTTCSD